MKTVNIHEAKTHLSRLLEGVAQGEPFIIAKAGKPVAKVVALENETGIKARKGIMAGRWAVPENVDAFGREEIDAMFDVEGRDRT